MKKLVLTQNDFSLVKEGIEAVAVQESTGQVSLFDYYYTSGYGYGSSSWSSSSSDESGSNGYWLWAEHDYVIESSSADKTEIYTYSSTSSSGTSERAVTLHVDYYHGLIDDYQVWVDGNGVIHGDQTQDYGDYEHDYKVLGASYDVNINGHLYSGEYREIRDQNLVSGAVVDKVIENIDPLNIIDISL